MSQIHGTSANTLPGRAGGALLLLSLLGLLGGCEATYDDTKGWANRLEASILKAAHEMEGNLKAAVAEHYTPETVAAPQPPPGAEAKTAMAVDAGTQSAPAAAMSPIPAVPPEGLASLRAPAAAKAEPDGAAKRPVPPLPKRKPQPPKAVKESVASKVPESPDAVAPDAVAMVLHLSSLRSEEAAKREWRTLKRDFPAALGKLEAEIRRTPLGDKGIFYRVLAGPLPTRSEAQAACDAVKARDAKQYCRVMPSPPAKKAPS